MINLDSLLHNFLSSGITLSDRETVRKIKALNIIQMVFVVTAPPLGLFYFYIGAIRLFYITIAAGLLMMTAIILLRMIHDLNVTGNYVIFIIWATVLSILWYSGPTTKEGMVTPAFMLDGGLIILAFFLNGTFWGTFWAGVVLVKSWVIVYALRAHYPPQSLIPAEISEPYAFGIYSSAILILFVISLLYERARNEVLRRADRKSDALEASKKLLHKMLEGFRAPTFILDRNHRVTAWNDACRKMTGVSPEEIVGKPVWKGLRIDDRGSLADIILEDPDSIMEDFGDAVVSQTDNGWFTLEMSSPNMNASGRVTVSATEILGKNGRVIGAIQIIEDIKDRRRDSAIVGRMDLEPSDGAFADPVFKIDTKGLVSSWNAACEENFGYPSSQMVGTSPWTLLSKAHLADFQQTVSDVLEKDVSFKDKQWKFYSRDKKPVFVLAKAYPSATSEDAGKQCVIVGTDITAITLKVTDLERQVTEGKESLKKLSKEYELLKKNIAAFIRGKGGK